MRLQGIIKIVVTLIVSFFMIAIVAGGEIATIAMVLILLYAWLGEYLSLLCDGAISSKNLNDYEREKLERIKKVVAKEVKKVSGEDISNLKLHIVPSNQINAIAYGFDNVSFTRNALASCDEMTLCSILGHEVSHILSLDAVFNRIIFGDITLVIIVLMLMSSITVIGIWLILIILFCIGICRSAISVVITSGLSNITKTLFEAAQHGVLFVYQVVMGFVSRSAEYRADQYSVELGYGTQLEYFLDRFVDDGEYRKKSLREILYAPHPATYNRIQKIRQLNKIE